MLKQKLKICKTCNKEKFIFSKGECKECNAKSKTLIKKPVTKKKLVTLAKLKKEARYWFQRWIRIRDLGNTCISCNTPLKDIRDYDAGHYYNAKNYPTLLFNELNVSGQCKFCNDHLSGNLIEYRKGLLKRYGIEVVEQLEEIADDKRIRTLTKEHYIEIAEKYKKLINK